MRSKPPLSLDEARRMGRLREFIKAHDSKPDPEATDPEARFDRLLELMAKGSVKDDQT